MAPALNVGRRRSTQSTVTGKPLSRSTLHGLERWWRAANYLSVGQIYLMGNPLLREPLLPEHVKPRLLGHWGTTPGLNFVYAHLNRAITRARPRHDVRHRPRARRSRAGGVGVPAGGHLQRGLPRHRPGRGRDCAGCSRSSPSPAASRATWRRRRPGRSTRAASSATRCRTRTAPPSTTRTWSSRPSSATARPRPVRWPRAGTRNKFVDPRRDGAVLPILHLNGYKIANPTVLARIPEDELDALLRGYGHTPYVVAGDDPDDDAPGVRGDPRPLPRRDPRRSSERGPRRPAQPSRPRLADDRAALPKGWTGPKEVDGQRDRGLLALPPGAVRRRPRRRRPPRRSSRSGCAATAPRSCSTPTGAPGRRRSRDLHPARRAADERQPARQRRPAAARPAAARLPRRTPCRSPSPAPARSRPPGCSARSCAT